MTPEEAQQLLTTNYLVCPNCHRTDWMKPPPIVKLPVRHPMETNGPFMDVAVAICICGHLSLFAKNRG